jgi:hypothetical protein
MKGARPVPATKVKDNVYLLRGSDIDIGSIEDDTAME